MQIRVAPARTGAWLVLLLAAALLLPQAATAEKLSQVRYFLDSEADMLFLQSHPELDVTFVKPGVLADIAANEEDLKLLRSSGARLEIVHDDIKEFYLNRLGPEKSDDFGIYHNWQEVVAFVDSLRLLYPQVISQKWSLGQGHEGRDIWCFRVSDNPDVDEAEPEILFDALHHAREPMSAEFVIMFAEYLAQNYGTDPEITWLLDNREVYIVPVVNPDGYWYNDWADMWRGNRRDNPGSCDGVDNNRNYPYEWGGVGSSGDPCDETYRGPSAGSEPETQALMGLINAHQFVVQNSYHCYGNYTLIPWGYTNDPTPENDLFMHMGNIMTMYNGYVAGQPGVALNYRVSGGTIDWCYGEQVAHNKIYAFSNELGSGSDYFWPPESRRGALFQENIWPAVYLMRAAGVFVEANSPTVLGGDGNGRLDPGESASLSFLLDNQGVTTAAQNVAVTLACDDPYLQLGSAYRYVGGIAALSSADLAGDPIPVTIAADCPVGRTIGVTATVAHAGGAFDYELSYLVGEPVEIFSDDFEGGTGAWTLTGTWGLTTSSSNSPTHSLTDSPVGNYDDNTTTSATTNASFNASTLSFMHHYDIEEDWDYGYVQTSIDGGPWNTVATYTGLLPAWSPVFLSLDVGKASNLRLRFQLVTDTYVTEDGWYIDDVVLFGSPSSNVAPASPVLASPAPAATVGATPTLIVDNSSDPDGSGPVTYGFRVYTDVLLTDLAASVDGIAEGASQTEWTTPSLANGTYYWRAYAADPTESGLMGEIRSFEVDDISGIGEIVGGLRFAALGPVASGQVRFQLELPDAAAVTLTIYDARGSVVRKLAAGTLSAGNQTLSWDGRDSGGRNVASGVYFARLQVQDEMLTDRFLLVR